MVIAELSRPSSNDKDTLLVIYVSLDMLPEVVNKLSFDQLLETKVKLIHVVTKSE